MNTILLYFFVGIFVFYFFILSRLLKGFLRSETTLGFTCSVFFYIYYWYNIDDIATHYYR